MIDSFSLHSHPHPRARTPTQSTPARAHSLRLNVFLSGLLVAMLSSALPVRAQISVAEPAGLHASAQLPLPATAALPTAALPTAALPTAALPTAPLPDDPSAVPSSAATDSNAAALALVAPGIPSGLNALPGDDDPSPQTKAAQREASTRSQYIPPGWEVEAPLSAHQKVVLGVRGLYTPFSLVGILLSAGYAQVTDGQPNYGVNRVAFGKRVGATLLRDSTEEIFSTSVFAPLLHEDPRYYVEGPKYSFVHRTLYSITRPLVTRSDSGRTTVNGSLLLGYAASSALTYTYYPQINKNFDDTVATFGGAVGGAALGFFATEFSADVLQKLHLGKLL